MCHDKLENMTSISAHASGKTCRTFDLAELEALALQDEDPLMKQWANLKLSKFREIHYFLPDHVFSDEEKEMLWTNRLLFLGHDVWMMQLLKSIDYLSTTQSDLQEVDRLLRDFQELDQHQPKDEEERLDECWKRMCSRTCKQKMSFGCALQLLNQTVKNNSVRAFALSCLDECKDESELVCFIPYLVRHSLYAPIIYKWLIGKCCKSELIAGTVFWAFQTYLDCSTTKRTRMKMANKTHGEYIEVLDYASAGPHIVQVVQEALSEWKRAVPEAIREKIYNSYQFVQHLRKYGSSNFAASLEQPDDGGEKEGIYYVIDVSRGKFVVDTAHVRVIDSVTRPVVIPFLPNGNNEAAPRALLWKYGDLRKEQVIANTISMFKIILKREDGIDLCIEPYTIGPCSSRDGFVEMIDGCISLAELREKGMDILPWIIERNDTTSAGELRDRFVNSCASYCVICYMLGIGDRHLNNLLVTPSGSLLHVDFSFVLGQDPKPIEKPQMRITPTMVSAMNGINSPTYKRFQALASTIYNCARRHVNLFATMLRMLVDALPQITENGPISEELLMKEIRRRFAPGESHKEAEIILQSHIHNSTTQTIQYAVVDFFQSNRRVSSAISSSAKAAITSLWTVVRPSDAQPDNEQ